MAKKKKVKIHWFRLTLVLALCIATTSFAVTKTVELIRSYTYEQEQMARRDYIAGVIQERKSFVNEINAIQLPEGVDEEQFEEIKESAIHDEIADTLDEYNYVSEDIPDEYYVKIQEIGSGSFENDYSRLLEVIDLIPANYIESLLEDWDRYDFTMAYLNQSAYQNAPDKLDVSLKEVPLLIQWDLDWGYIPYGDLNIALAGCAPTCISMVYSYLLQDPTITPARVAKAAEDMGMYVSGAGSSHEIFGATANAFGVNYLQIGASQSAIDEALKAGNPVILNMVPGDFTKVGHFIVATGIEDGQYKINDPNSKKRSAELWDPEVVLSQTNNAWVFAAR